MALAIDIVAGGKAKSASETLLALSYLERARDTGRSLGFSSFGLMETDERKLAAAVVSPFVVALDERGKSFTSEGFARDLAKWRDAGESRLVFAIGGSDGLPADVKRQARLTMAFGTQTWPHLLVRTMLAEQLYRAVTILGGHPYHRT